jgi:hypothetical protein
MRVAHAAVSARPTRTARARRCTATAHRRTEMVGRRRLTGVETAAQCAGRWAGARGGGSGAVRIRAAQARRRCPGVGGTREAVGRASGVRRSAGERREASGGRAGERREASVGPVRRAMADKRDLLVSDF